MICIDMIPNRIETKFINLEITDWN